MRASHCSLASGSTLALLAPVVPREQEVVFQLGDHDVKRIAASFTPDGEREASTGVTLSFDCGAPPRVRHKLSLPNGRYVVAVEVERRGDDGSKTESYVRRVDLRGEETIVAVQDAP